MDVFFFFQLKLNSLNTLLSVLQLNIINALLLTKQCHFFVDCRTTCTCSNQFTTNRFAEHINWKFASHLVKDVWERVNKVMKKQYQVVVLDKVCKVFAIRGVRIIIFFVIPAQPPVEKAFLILYIYNEVL